MFFVRTRDTGVPKTFSADGSVTVLMVRLPIFRVDDHRLTLLTPEMTCLVYVQHCALEAISPGSDGIRAESKTHSTLVLHFAISNARVAGSTNTEQACLLFPPPAYSRVARQPPQLDSLEAPHRRPRGAASPSFAAGKKACSSPSQGLHGLPHPSYSHQRRRYVLSSGQASGVERAASLRVWSSLMEQRRGRSR